MKKLVFILWLGCLAATAQAQGKAKTKKAKANVATNEGRLEMYTTVDNLLKEAKVFEKRCNNNLLYLPADTAGLKITRTDVAKLVDIVYSQQRCRCLVSYLSSYRPAFNEYSTLGGLAMDMIDAYRNGTKYPGTLYSLTKTDSTRADEIVQWWSREKEK